MANQIVQSQIFRKRAINPILKLLEYNINKEIISEFGYNEIKFKFLIFDVCLPSPPPAMSGAAGQCWTLCLTTIGT